MESTQPTNSAYAEALTQAADNLEDNLAAIRAESTAGRLTPAGAAAERAQLLEQHLKHLEQLRLEHLGGTA
jgi:hypothetical protein